MNVVVFGESPKPLVSDAVMMLDMMKGTVDEVTDHQA